MIPVLFALRYKTPKQSFTLGFLTGWAAFCGILYWIIPTFLAARVSPWVGILSLALLASYVALYYGLFFALLISCANRLSLDFSIFFGAAFWGALEFVRNYLFTGFPWGNLGYSQWLQLPHIQFAKYAGVYGVSSMVVLFNLFIFVLIYKRTVRRWTLISFVAIFAAVIFLSHNKNPDVTAGGAVPVSILQGNIDQYHKWDPDYVLEIQKIYSDLAGTVSSEGKSGLVFWPETAVPGWIPNDEKMLDWLSRTVQKSGGNHVAGAVSQVGPNSRNSAFLLSPDGKIIGRYDKMHLVPFGEFVPLQKILGGWIPVLNELGGFSSGEFPEILRTPHAALGVSVCYESVFPEIAREETRRGAQVLVNLTNDGWYLDTAAPEQHFAMNVFRAVENGRPLVRAANTGISGLIGADGRVLFKTKIGERTVLKGEVYPSETRTFYTRQGDLFAWACVLVSLLGIGFMFVNVKNT